MSTAIAALPPPNHPILHKQEWGDGTVEVPEYSFSDLWQNPEEGMSFGDFLDIINPLQHIPIVSAIYRAATGDEAGVGSRLIGGALFGGPLGVLVSGLTSIAEEASGGPIEHHIASLWNSVTEDPEPSSQTAGVEIKKAAPEEPPAVEDDYAALATQPSRLPVAAPEQPGDPVSAFGSNTTLQPAVPAPFSPQPLPRPPVSVSPLTAVHRVQNQSAPEIPATTTENKQSQRISQAIERAQKAQAALLVASLGNSPVENKVDDSGNEKPQDVQPFSSHPYLLPQGAPPQLISRAMEQALAKYQATLQQRHRTSLATPQSALPGTGR